MGEHAPSLATSQQRLTVKSLSRAPPPKPPLTHLCPPAANAICKCICKCHSLNPSQALTEMTWLSPLTLPLHFGLVPEDPGGWKLSVAEAPRDRNQPLGSLPATVLSAPPPRCPAPLRPDPPKRPSFPGAASLTVRPSSRGGQCSWAARLPSSEPPVRVLPLHLSGYPAFPSCLPELGCEFWTLIFGSYILVGCRYLLFFFTLFSITR